MTRTQAWEIKQELDQMGLIHNHPVQEFELHSLGIKEPLEGNEKVGCAFRKSSLDIVRHGLQLCFPTFLHIMAYTDSGHKGMVHCGQ